MTTERWSAKEAREFFRTGQRPRGAQGGQEGGGKGDRRHARPSRKPPATRTGASEHEEQVALFRWVRENEAAVPELALLYAVPNGGHRRRAVAVKLKAEGVRPGVPDIHLPVARGGFHGLWIEMKVGRNTMTGHQKAFTQRLREQGHRVEVCYGAETAAECIRNYLHAPKIQGSGEATCEDSKS